MTKEEQQQIVKGLISIAFSHPHFGGACEQAANLIEQQARELENAAKIIRSSCEDWADDDTRVKELAKPFFTEKEINGDSYGVPGVIDIAELMAKRIEQQAREIEELKAHVKMLLANDTIEKMDIQLTTLKAENERLRKVIQFFEDWHRKTLEFEHRRDEAKNLLDAKRHEPHASDIGGDE